MVVHTDEDVLLLKRCRPFEFWQSVTGSLDPGEEPRDAALRELREETGFTGEGELIATGVCRRFVIDPRWRNRYAEGVIENDEHEFRYRLARQLPVNLCAVEHSTYRWLPFGQAAEQVWSWTNREALETLAGDLA